MTSVSRNTAASHAVVIFALGLSARWIYVSQSGNNLLGDIPVGNAISYIQRAAGEVSGFASLYDALLAGVAGSGSQDYTLVRGIQVVLGACNCVMAWSLARTIFSLKVAVAAGLAAAVYGPSIYFSGELQPTVLATSLVLVSLILLSRALAAAEARSYVLPGLLLGLTVLSAWWVSLFALAVVVWLLRQKDQGVGAAGYLVGGMAALLLPALLWSAWTPDAVDFGLAGLSRVYALWQGSEFLQQLDPYYARQHSALLAPLLWDAGLAFPFGLVAPLALIGMVSRLRVQRQPVESMLLLFCGCFAIQALLLPGADSAVRSIAVPSLLIFAAVGVAALGGLPRRRVPVAIAAGLVVAVGLNAGDAGAAGRARQHHWLGHAFEQLELRANAAREYETAIGMDPGSQDTYYALAKLYLAQGDNIRAGGLYQSLLQRWPDQVQARAALAAQYMTAGRAPEAVQLYRELIGTKANSETAGLLPLLGWALVRSGDIEGAIKAFGEALEFGLGNTEVRATLALLYATTDQLPLAVDAYRILFEAGGVTKFGPRLAEVLIASERDADAADVLEQVLQAEPASTAALALRGKQLFEQGNPREAAIHFERLSELSPEDYRVYFFLTKIYQQLGEGAKADDAFALYEGHRRQKERQGVQEHMDFVTSEITDQLKSMMEPK